jgi:hypothetical protein
MKRLSAITLCGLLFVMTSLAFVQARDIHDAAAKSDTDKVQQLVQADPTLVNVGDDDGATPMHWACAAGSNPVVEFLLSSGANVNAKRKNGVTPLHVACAMGKTQVVTLLLAKGADVNAKDKLGRTPLSVAQKNKQTAVVKILSNHKPAQVKPAAVPKSSNADKPGQPAGNSQPPSHPTDAVKPPTRPAPKRPEFPPAQGSADKAERPAFQRRPNAGDRPSPQQADPVGGGGPLYAPHRAIANEIAQLLVKEDYAGIVAKFDDTMKASLPVDTLKDVWVAAKVDLGAFKQIAAIKVEEVEKYKVVVATMAFEKAKLDLQVTLNDARQVSGLFIRPSQAPNN